MNDKLAISEAAESRSQIRIIGRTIVVALLLLAATYGAYSVGCFAAAWRREIPPRSAVQREVLRAASFAPPLPVAGQWSFADVDWDFRSRLIEQEVLPAYFDQLAAASGQTGDGEQLDDVGARLVQLARDLGIKPVRRNENEVYRLERPAVTAQLVIRHDGEGLRVLSLAWAHANDDLQWHLAEFKPRRGTDHAKRTIPHLLPLPAGARREGGRYADDGSLLLEFAALDSSAEALKRFWQAAGLEVRPSGLSDADSFSYLCRSGNEIIYAWSPDDNNAIGTLLLVRCPGGGDTSP